MKTIIFLALFTQICAGIINDSRSDSFQVNVSAGYGVHENNTLTTPKPPPDNVMEPSMHYETHITPSYQVQEKISDAPRKYRKRYNKPRPRIPDNRFAGTRIIEVLRVPAMYELRLQADPQRLMNWMHKLKQRKIKEAKSNQFKHSPEPMTSESIHSFQKIIHHPVPITQKNISAPVSYQSVSTEIADANNKPQALHEVPPPVLHKPVQVVPKPTIAGLIYGKPVTRYTRPVYTTTTEPSTSPIWSSIEPPTTTPFEPVTTEPEDHYNQFRINNAFTRQNYQGLRHVQNLYNDDFGDFLDQNLANGSDGDGLKTYLNDDGTMTVSNFDNGPQVYDSITTMSDQGLVFNEDDIVGRADLGQKNIGRRMFKGLNRPMNYVLHIREKNFD